MNTKRLSAIIMILVLLVLCAPALAAKDLEVDNGQEGVDYTYTDGGVLTVLTDKEIMISGTSVDNRIVIDPGVNKEANVIFSGLQLGPNDDASVVWLKSGTLNLTIRKENKLLCSGDSNYGSGSTDETFYVPSGTKVILKEYSSGSGHSLSVYGYGIAAAMGASVYGDITFESGSYYFENTLSAGGAAIGGSAYTSSSSSGKPFGTITINGGIVKAKGEAWGGAAIGGAHNSTQCGPIVVNGGELEVDGRLGGGTREQGSDNARGTYTQYGGTAKVKILNAKTAVVEAGTLNLEHAYALTINDGNVISNSGVEHLTMNGGKLDIDMTKSAVPAYANSAGLGGTGRYCNQIFINGGEVTVNSMQPAVGAKSTSDDDASGSIVFNGGKLSAYSSKYAGIGSNNNAHEIKLQVNPGPAKNVIVKTGDTLSNLTTEETVTQAKTYDKTTMTTDRHAWELTTIDAAVHTHTACGEYPNACTHSDAHTNLTYTAWNGNNSNIFSQYDPETKNLYLTGDVTLSEIPYVYGNDTLNLCLNGHTLYVNSVDGLVNNGTLNLCDCTGGGSIEHESGHYGVGVTNTGTFNMYGGRLSGHNASSTYSNRNAGAVYNAGTFNMYDGELSGNSTSASMNKRGLGVFVLGDSTFNMYGGRICNNNASYYRNAEYGGGGVYVARYGEFNMFGGEISRNTHLRGGGVYVQGTFRMSGGTITGNNAHDGAGVHVTDYPTTKGTFRMSGGTITGNHAIYYMNSAAVGGGVSMNGYMHVSGDAAVTGNTAERQGKSNVYLSAGSVMSRSDALSGSIGVTTETKPTETAPVDYLKNGATESDRTHTFSDEGYKTRLSGTVLQLYTEPTVYTITYDLDDGSLGDGDENPTTYTSADLPITLKNPTRNGYDFAGWTSPDLSKATVSVTIPVGAVGNRIYTATWTEAHSHQICGVKNCTDNNHTGHAAAVRYIPWDGVSELASSKSEHYVYLSADATISEPVTVSSGKTLYLCLYGHSLTSSKNDNKTGVIEVKTGGKLILCDCQKSVNAKITHASDMKGRGVTNNGTFEMYGGHIVDNNTSSSQSNEYGAGVMNTAGSVFKLYSGSISGNTTASAGAGVYANGTMTMYGGEISGNTGSANGGGVCVFAEGDTTTSFTMLGGKIKNNSSMMGGGVDVHRNSNYSASVEDFVMKGGEISGNTADFGAGVRAYQTGVRIEGGEISGNIAQYSSSMAESDWNGNGGGVYVQSGKLTLDGGSIKYNKAHLGGGVYNTGSAAFTMAGGKIAENNQAVRGSGVYNTGSAAFTMTGGVITGNTADEYGGVIVGASMTISGSPVIRANTDKDGWASNVYLASGQVMTVSGTLEGYENIGVSMAQAPTAANPVLYLQRSGDSVMPSDLDATYADMVERASVDSTVDTSVYDKYIKNSKGYFGPAVSISVSVSPSAAGTVTGAGSYISGDSVTLSATPDTGYSFLGWYDGDNLVASSASYSFTASTSLSLTAKFEPIKSGVTIEASPANAGTVTGAGTYSAGSSVSIGATAANGYNFFKWEVVSGDAVLADASAASTSFTMPANGVSLRAVFIKPHSHKVCGEEGTCSDPNHKECGSDVAYTPWDGVAKPSLAAGSNYLYLTKDAEYSDGQITVASGQTLYLCLYNHTLTYKGTELDTGVITADGGRIVLCDCGTGGTLTASGTKDTRAITADNGGKIEMYGGTIKDFLIDSGLTCYGVALYAKDSDVTLYGGTITENKNDGYGAVAVHTTDNTPSVFTMYGGAVSKNYVTSYRTSHVTGVYLNGCTANILGGTISNNAGGAGLGLYKSNATLSDCSITQNMRGIKAIENSTVTVKSGTIISENRAVGKGGGIALDQSSLIMEDGKISENTVSVNNASLNPEPDDDNPSGAGVHVLNGSITMTGGEISGNTNAKRGGGVYLAAGGTLTMTGGKITGNSVTAAGGGVDAVLGGITLGGNAEITGNTLNGVANNVALDNVEGSGRELICLTGQFTGSVGVTVSGTPAADNLIPYLYHENASITTDDLEHTFSDAVAADSSLASVYDKRVHNARGVFGPALHVLTLENAKLGDGSTGGSFAAGTSLTITPDLPENTVFTGWEVSAGDFTLTDDEKTASSLSIFMPAGALSLKANYANETLNIKAAVSGFADNGVIRVDGRENAKSHEFTVAYGTTVTLTAEPNPGYYVNGWKQSGSSNVLDTDAEYSFTAKQDIDLIVDIVPYEYSYTIKVSPEDGGTATNTNGVTSGKITYGFSEDLIATPAQGYSFVHWTAGEGEGTFESPSSANTQFTIGAGNAEITAVFELEHAHAVCGADVIEGSCSQTSHSDHTEQKVFLPWDGSADLVLESGEHFVYLVNDVTTDSSIVARNGATLHLCLNGKMLASGADNAVDVAQGSTFTLCDCIGTDVNTWGKITRKAGTYGRGIRTNGMLEIYGGHITGHDVTTEASSTKDGAGVLAQAQSSLVLYNGAITNNKSGFEGGGVYMHKWSPNANGDFIMYNGLIDSNIAAEDGGGVNLSGAHFIMHGGTISKNTASNSGGGVYNAGKITMNNGGVSDNTAAFEGGGIYNLKTSPGTGYHTLTMNGGYVARNKAGSNAGGMNYGDGLFFQGGAGVAMNTVGTGNVANNIFLKKNELITINDNLTGTIGSSKEVLGITVANEPTVAAPVPYVKRASNTVTQDDLDHTFADAVRNDASKAEFYEKRINASQIGEFAPVEYALTLVNAKLSNGNTGGDFSKDEQITITADVPKGYQLTGWVRSDNVAVSGNDNSIEITMPDGKLTVTAVIEAIRYKISYVLDEGTLSEGIVNPEEYSVDTETFTLHNPMKDGFDFLGWICKQGDVPQLTVTIEKGSMGNLDFTAVYAESVYEITAIADPSEGGSITGTGRYRHGASVTLTASPSEGWRFVCWMEDGAARASVQVSGDAAYAFTVLQPRALRAVFAKLEPPVIIGQPEDVSVMEGETATFTTLAQSELPMTYRWQIDRSDGQGFVDLDCGEPSYTTPAARAEDSGSLYRCIIENKDGSVTTEAAVLTVSEQPKSYEITAIADPEEGGTVTGAGLYLSGAAVTLTAAPSEGWRFIGWMEESEAGASDQVGSDAAYTFTAQKPRILRAAFAKLEPPVITGQPVDAFVIAGRTAVFTVTVQSELPVTYRWQIDRGDGQGFVDLDCGEPSYTTPAARAEDSGSLYRCIIENEDGSVTTEAAVLTVSEHPESYEITAIADPEEGGTVTGAGLYLSGASVTLTASPSEGWRFVGWMEEREAGTSDQIGSDATYTFTAQKPRTLRATFAMLKPPVITGQPVDAFVMAGQTAVFTASVQSELPVTYRWQIDRGDGQGFVDLDCSEASYITTPTCIEDSGFLYRCIIENAEGSVTTATAVLTVNEEQPVLPDTGDSSNLFLSALLATLSLVGASLLVMRRRTYN